MPDTDTPLDLADTCAELRRLLAEATPGDWRVEMGGTHLEIRAPHQEKRSVARVYCDIDAALIAAAHNHLPALLDERDRLRLLTEGRAA